MNTIWIDCDIPHVNGSAKGRVSAHDGNTLLHEDRIDLSSATSRKRFATAVAGKVNSPESVADIESLLLTKLAELRGAQQSARDGFDVSRIVRPDLFITPQVMGLSVPQPMLIDGRPAAKWSLYLLREDGSREARELPDALGLPDGTKLWFHPPPCDPTPNTLAGWSPPSRRRWLEGADTPDPVAVFERLCATIDYFIDFPEEHARGMTTTLALWIMLGYVYLPWDAVPYLYVGGPQNSGKSRTFDVLARVVRRPLLSSNTTGPCLFRTLHDQGGTVLFDEAERLKDTAPEAGELRSILLAGNKRGGRATRLEKVGDGFKPVEYECYGPKALACINGLPPPLASRCIPFIMFRAAADSEKPKRRVDADPQLWVDLRDDLHALALGPMGRAAIDLSRRSDVCDLSNRNYELWQPITAIAAWLEALGASGTLATVQAHAAYIAESSVEDATPDTDETVLRILADEVAAGRMPTSGEVLARAKQKEPETFQRWIARTVSNALGRYGLRSKKHGHDGRRYRDVSLGDLRKIELTYHLDLGIGESAWE